jgi:hypothetical protein
VFCRRQLVGEMAHAVCQANLAREQVRSYRTGNSKPSVGICRRQLVGEMAARCVRPTSLANKFAPTERIFPCQVSASVGDNLLARWPTRCVRQTPLANKFAPTERIFPSRVSAPVGDNLLARWPTRCVRPTSLANKFAPTERVIPSRVSASVGDNLLARWLRGLSGKHRSRTSSLLQKQLPARCLKPTDVADNLQR